MSDKKLYLECECHSPDHLTTYSFYDWGPNEMPELLLMVQASEYRSWYHRVKSAIKYIFKGHGIEWHDVMIRYEDSEKLIQMLQEYKLSYEKWLESEKNDKS